MRPDATGATNTGGKGLRLDVRKHLTYSNVVATLALFIALGGSSYAALTLPKNSVGSKQLRAKAVGSSELRSRAVRGRHIAADSVTTSKLSRSTREALRGNTGPMGPAGPAGPSGLTYKVSLDSNNRRIRGSEVGATPPERGLRIVEFERSIRECVATATLAKTNAEDRDPPPGRITVAQTGDDVLVRTYDRDGNPENIGFNLIVAC